MLFFFLAPNYTNPAFSSWLLRFHYFSSFSAFSSQSNPSSEDILETQDSTIDSVYGLLLLSRAPQQDSIDAIVCKSFIFSSLI